MPFKNLLKDRSKRDLVFKRELWTRCLKGLSNNLKLPILLRRSCFYSYATLQQSSSETQLRNRCTLTGRGRGVYRFFKLSRFHVKAGVLSKVLPYVRKSS